ncbi:hypothetical protein C8J57DRAFT_1567508 [Mycena rebaudengoi]|nr:hypothetical protein C8J57DRAFT_1567508 [Mycena rebaudengoi]
MSKDECRLGAFLDGPPPFPSRSKVPLTFSTLPPHLLLQIIVHMTFPQSPSFNEERVEPCTYVLRSTYLPAYDSLIRATYSSYSSDPFPFVSSPQSAFTYTNPAHSRLGTIQRETATLDLFIALKVREDWQRRVIGSPGARRLMRDAAELGRRFNHLFYRYRAHSDVPDAC